MPPSALHAPVLAWYARAARALPWRAPGTTPWGVLVSEVMLQQTPVARVEPVWRDWVRRWPLPRTLAGAPAGDAVRAWGRLGYPRRALRLHAAAVALTTRHGGEVPADLAALRQLPGVGGYTAAAVASFAFGQRHPVVDTNVRRVHSRAVGGRERPPPALTAGEVRAAADLLPDDSATAARWSVAVMELGALVCTARTPRCESCPVRPQCVWHLAGRPAAPAEGRRRQAWTGTDRQVRGSLLAVLRHSDAPVDVLDLAAAWPQDDDQRRRCLASLVADGLVQAVPGGRYALPGAPAGSRS